MPLSATNAAEVWQEATRKAEVLAGVWAQRLHTMTKALPITRAPDATCSDFMAHVDRDVADTTQTHWRWRWRAAHVGMQGAASNELWRTGAWTVDNTFPEEDRTLVDRCDTSAAIARQRQVRVISL